MMSFASDSAFHGLYFDILELCGRSYFFMGSNLEKYGNLFEKQPFFWADMARLGKYPRGQIWPDWCL